MNLINEDEIPKSAKNTVLDVIILLIILFPFLLISFYNHPIGDDFWFSALVRKYGFLKAESIIFKTVSARFSALSIMGINPLVFGNLWLYRLIPVLFILSFFLVLSFFIQNLVSPHAKSKYVFLLSALFTAIYISVLPGIGEGVYWVSSLVSYQFGNMFLLLWLALLKRHFDNKKSRFYGPASIMAFLILLGFNETIAIVGTLVNLALMFGVMARRIRTTIVINAVLSVPVLYFMISSGSISVRYFWGDPPGIQQLLHSVFLATIKSGYHILNCVVNPLFWVGILLAGPCLKHLYPGGQKKNGFNIPIFLFYLFVWLFAMILISFLPNYFSPEHVVPLRISNVIVFIFLTGLLYATLYISRAPERHNFFKKLEKWEKYRNPSLVALFVLAFFLRNNFSTATRDLLSGSASRYDREMENRIRLLQDCKTDTCIVPVLQNRPVSIRYSTYDNDHHIGDYFHKVILYDGN